MVRALGSIDVIPGFDSPTRCHMWVQSLLLALALLQQFSSGSQVFLLLRKTTCPNSSWIRIEDPPAKTDLASSLKIVFFSNPSLSLLNSCRQCPTIQRVVPYRLMTNKQADKEAKNQKLKVELESKKSRKIETSINIHRNDPFLQSKRYQNPI